MGKGSLEVFGHQRRLDGRKFDGAFFEVDCFTKELTKNVTPTGLTPWGFTPLMEPMSGLEPLTYALRVRRSAN